jgi:EAL and modified HD-GYP domain-containing signal transduction protein
VQQLAGSAPADAAGVVHIGRQPLYDRAGEVMGYELLFRGGVDAVDAPGLGAHATSHVIVNAFTEFGLDQLAGDRRCFINVTRDFLVGALPLPFDPGTVVLEVLADVGLDDEVVAGAAALADSGFELALDDVVFGAGRDALLGLASYVKIDLLERDPAEVTAAVRAARRHPHLRLVAERLQTPYLVDVAHTLGFEYLQGYALGRPQVLSVVTLSPGRLRRLELLGRLMAADVSLDEVVGGVVTDPALCYRLLQATNSAAVSLARKVHSVRDAVVLLGIARVREWVSLMLVSDIATEASDEQLAATMSSARLCQTVAERMGLAADAGFTVGLIRGLSDLLGEPVADLVGRMPLADEVVDALVRGAGPLGQVLAVTRAYDERDVAVLAGAPVSSADLARAYLGAAGWSMRTVTGALARRPQRPTAPRS